MSFQLSANLAGGETATDAAKSEPLTLRKVGHKSSLWQFILVRNLKRIRFESDSDNKCLAYLVINPSWWKINYSSYLEHCLLRWGGKGEAYQQYNCFFWRALGSRSLFLMFADAWKTWKHFLLHMSSQEKWSGRKDLDLVDEGSEPALTVGDHLP